MRQEDIKMFEVADGIYVTGDTPLETAIEIAKNEEEENPGEDTQAIIDDFYKEREEEEDEQERVIESVIMTMDNYRIRMHNQFKDGETFWKHYNNELRSLLEYTV